MENEDECAGFIFVEVENENDVSSELEKQSFERNAFVLIDVLPE